jgi:signal peptidase I
MNEREKRAKSWLVAVYRYLRNVFAIVGVALVIYHFCFEVTAIYSNSMAPTLKGDGSSVRDYVLVEKVSRLFRKPRRWEILKFHTQDELSAEVMKRVVALEGETISIKDQWIHIDGQPVERPAELDFLEYVGAGDLHRGKEVKCEGGYFLLGDDTRDSYDSRFTGVLKTDDIEGRAWMIVWPPSRIRLLTP